MRNILFILFMVPGLILAGLPAIFMEFGDGTGNESGMAKFWSLAFVVSVIFWVASIGGLAYWWMLA